MKKVTLLFFSLLALTSKAQFSVNQVQYWVGSGSDSAVLIVDFHSGTFDSSTAWGYLYNSGATMEDMLNAVAQEDTNFSVNLSGGFLNDIHYHIHSGVGGTNNQYWATYTGQDFNSLTGNTGISETVQNGYFYACSFTAFNPNPPYNALLDPGVPISAFEPFAFTKNDISFWIGSGSDSTILVVDFLSLIGISSNAFGYIHDGTKTAEDMLNDIALAYPSFTVDMTGGFLNDITFNINSGIGGNPNYWGTWSASNLGNWQMNSGISENLSGVAYYGCSYTDFNPVLRPNKPFPAGAPNGINEVQMNVSVYPNPTTDFLYLNMEGSCWSKIIDLNGKLILESPAKKIDVSQLPSGIYSLSIQNKNHQTTIKWIKE